MSKKILEVINAEKYYGEKGNVTKALDDISFSVNEGEFLGIMGASGSGKTTLLNCISTIDKLSAGKVLINGENINGLKGGKLDAFRRDELGFIFQDFNLLDNMTAFENIAILLSFVGGCRSNVTVFLGKDRTVLKIGDAGTEYEVCRAFDQTVEVVTALCPGRTVVSAESIYGVLVGRDAAAVEEEAVAIREQRHGLSHNASVAG